MSNLIGIFPYIYPGKGPAFAIVVSCLTLFCLMAAPYDWAQSRKEHISFAVALPVGNGLISGISINRAARSGTGYNDFV